MYKLIWLISFIIRQWVLPNPFECFGDTAIIINTIASMVMVPLTYVIVGIWYKSGSEPSIGSILFLIVYVILTVILWVLGQFAFAWWAVIAMLALLIGVLITTRRLVNSDL